MRIDKFTYSAAESTLMDAMRKYLVGGTVQAERESNACLDETQTHHNINYINPTVEKFLRNRNNANYNNGDAFAEYHNQQVGGSYGHARVTGTEKEKSKSVGIIITLPRDYIEGAIPDLTDDEVEYLTNKHEANSNHQPFKKTMRWKRE